jgi:hypothetical protein
MANNRSLHYTFSLRVDSVDTLTPVRPLIGTVAGKSIPGTNLVTQDVSHFILASIMSLACTSSSV